MALTRRERAALAGRIADFMETEFAPVLARYYAQAVAYSSKHPQNINNELRNAITHMSRALCSADLAAADKEMASAERHVERFKRDCLKVTVVYASKDLGTMIRRAEVHTGKIDPSLTISAVAVITKRIEIMAKEVLGDTTAAAQWEDLLLDIERLRSKVMNSYPILNPAKYRYIIWFLRLWRWFKTASGFIVATVLAAAIGAAAIPDDKGFGEQAQKFVVELSGYLFGQSERGPSDQASQEVQPSPDAMTPAD